jgi:serine/threonine protein kinase
MTEEELFHAALAQPAAERAAFLEQACSGNACLRAAVEALLAAHEASGSFLTRDLPPGEPQSGDLDETRDSGLASAGAVVARKEHIASLERARDGRGTETADFRREAAVGVVIDGRFVLQERIGEGGMGEVWVAKQTAPVKRKVALKLIKTGMDSGTVLQRFEQERQALALMDHPNIARVLDGGVTASGQPFFVMELVNGLLLTKFCDNLKLTLKQRLELFVPICRAVQHAHQKGIVHRDLKPANILVTMIDGKPVPKVIDFGVAKATSGKLTEETMSTGFGAVVGTLEYMSPEQAGFSGEDIDTRADIYSLGVVLYELLTGLRPIDAKRLRKTALTEMIRIIREEEPSKPSTRLSTEESLPSLAAVRQIEPKKLTALLRGELDWVVMKCLEKQRDRRYETANALARDVQRYLADELVEARPPSRGYRLQKFLRKHKGQLIAAGLVCLALVAGVIGTSIGIVQAERARGIAEQRREEAELQGRRAEAGEKLAEERLVQVEAEKLKAEKEKQIAVAVKNFLQIKLLAQADVRTQANALLQGRRTATETKTNPTILELLDRAAEELVEDKIEASFPNQPLVQAEILRTVGDTYRGIAESSRAIGFLERSLSLRKTELGLEHPDTLDSMHHLAMAYWADGRRDQALPQLEQTLALMKANLGPEHPGTLSGMYNLALAYHQSGKLDLARPLAEQTLGLQKTQLGPEDPKTLHVMRLLASIYTDVGSPDLALPLAEESLAAQKSTLGPDHPDTLLGRNSLAVDYMSAGDTDRALSLLKESFELTKSKYGSDHTATVISMSNLAQAYRNAGKVELALPLQKETLTLSKAKLGPDHPDVVVMMNNLAATYFSLKKLDESIPLFEELLRVQEQKLGRNNAVSQGIVANLGSNYLDAGRLAEAIPLLEEAHRFSKTFPLLAWVERRLFSAYLLAGEANKAAGLLAECRQSGPKNSSRLAQLLSSGSRSLLEAGDDAEAELLLRELLALDESTQPTAWTTFNTQSMLGEALLGQKNYEEAELLLRQGYDGLKQCEQTLPANRRIRVIEAVQRLVELYEAIDKPGEVKKWQAELEHRNAAEQRRRISPAG